MRRCCPQKRRAPAGRPKRITEELVPAHCGIDERLNDGIHKHFPNEHECFAKERAAPISRVDMQRACQGGGTQAYLSCLAEFSCQLLRCPFGQTTVMPEAWYGVCIASPCGDKTPFKTFSSRRGPDRGCPRIGVYQSIVCRGREGQ